MLAQEAHQRSAAQIPGQALRRTMTGRTILCVQLRTGLARIEILLGAGADHGEPGQHRHYAWRNKPHLRHSVPPQVLAQSRHARFGFYTWPFFLWQTGTHAQMMLLQHRARDLTRQMLPAPS
jgi:hypothetical protein